MEQIQLYGSSASQDPLSKTANSQSDPGASHELCIAAHLQSDLTKARALHFLIVPFSTTVPSAPTADFFCVGTLCSNECSNLASSRPYFLMTCRQTIKSGQEKP